jgi:hypothetical protein
VLAQVSNNAIAVVSFILSKTYSRGLSVPQAPRPFAQNVRNLLKRDGPAIPSGGASTTIAMTPFPSVTEERDYFGWLPPEITRAVPESLINTIASMVCHAHRMGRKEAYNFLKQFVLEQMRMPDWPHYPMNDLRRMTPPPLPPTSGG